MRGTSAFVLFATLAASASAQSTQPPSAVALDRLGLRTEWVSAVPIAGERDGIATVQVAGPRQIFVQTLGGLLVSFDAATGDRQWTFPYETPLRNPMLVGYNDDYVFVVNVVKLYGIRRLTGVLDFTQKLPSAPTTAPAADANSVYVVMAGNRVAAYDLPPSLSMPDPRVVKAATALDPAATRRPGLRNPADVVASRYPAPTRNLNQPDETPERRSVRLTAAASGGAGLGQRTPSLTVAATLSAPYKAFDTDGRYLTNYPSLNVVRSLRQPYHLDDPTSRNTQRTPSLSSIPPSLAALHELTDLRPRGIELTARWNYGSSIPVAYTPLLTRARFWGLTQSQTIMVLTREEGIPQIDAELSAKPTAQATQAESVGYVPQEDGYLVAFDLDGGAVHTVRNLWKANVGGLMNASPVPTKAGIYQAGTNAGIARIDRVSGEVVWRTENGSDRLLAINEEHVYAADRYGHVYVYDRNRVSDVATKRAWPLAIADLPDFNVPVTNAQTDRVFLAASNGLFVCLRDTAPKYTLPLTVAPPKLLPPPVKAAIPKPAEKAPEKPKE